MNRFLGCLVLGMISAWGGNGMASLQAGPSPDFVPAPGEENKPKNGQVVTITAFWSRLRWISIPAKPTRLILYATPNGNTIEQTLGCALSPGIDWHFDIQHASAQVRILRPLRPEENLVLACVEARG